MEIKVYKSFQDLEKNKYFFCSKIECPDTFSFDGAVKMFKSICPNCIVLVMAV